MGLRGDVPKILSQKALKGLLAHEMAHVYQYQQGTFFDLLILMTKYSFSFISNKKFIQEFEKNADMIVIKHGFGKELLAFWKERQELIKKGKITNKYTSDYSTVEEIEKLVK